LARLREDDRLELFRLDDLRLRPPDDFRRVEPRAPRRAVVRPPFREDFLLLFLREDFLADLRLDDFLVDLRADFRRGLAAEVPPLRDSPISPYEEGEEAGVGAGVLSIGSGSIQPEPDQPISI
jgi:hypothetical protein